MESWLRPLKAGKGPGVEATTKVMMMMMMRKVRGMTMATMMIMATMIITSWRQR